ncbi:enoyl-CoA hydratase [Novosphingobium rosa]|uniref:enoyl-CoA hydratase n=1 Tax=Novosphingobium rosa TaxID=76978 RepID=UPI000835B737|nr:enoyl-CoA hydratase [Novosphingobium rosa]
MDDEPIDYDMPAPRVARIWLNRPQARNAQSTQLLYALNRAFDRAAQDDNIHVIILAARGPHFSAGHDLNEIAAGTAHDTVRAQQTVGTWCGFGCSGAEAQMAYEKEVYLGLSERWRNLPKPTIAQVHGKVITGGLMLVWPCDLIIAADDATFQDTAVDLGVCGVEFFNHPYELGIRQAKEFLFRAHVLTAQAAHAAGMVNHVVPRDRLEDFTLEIAREIARKPLFALKLAKEAVNAAQDAAGRSTVLHAAFGHHQLTHAHNMLVHGLLMDPTNLQSG